MWAFRKYRRKSQIFRYAILFILIVIMNFSLILANEQLQFGSKGRTVRIVQSYLQQINYLRANPTGYFGVLTRESVKSFQLEHGLESDGVVGPETWLALKEAFVNRNKNIEYIVKSAEQLSDIAVRFRISEAEIMAKNRLENTKITVGQRLAIPIHENRSRFVSRGRPNGVQVIPWSLINPLWSRSETAQLTDLETGLSLAVKRLGGSYHADVEPLTTKDTQKLFKIYGSRWSWERRAAIIRLRNLQIAALINGMPHGTDSIKNGFPGHFCVHFLGSRIHGNGKVDLEHQIMIEQTILAQEPGAEPELSLHST
jgi:peptidoglycan hydrolase-like protein with peptidoglycan-binding domain